jgi:hypothetical protein
MPQWFNATRIRQRSGHVSPRAGAGWKAYVTPCTALEDLWI